MATLSLRIRDTLKRKAEDLAKREGASLNNFINAMLAAVVAQEEALAFLGDRPRTVGLYALHRRVVAFMGKTRPGREPSQAELDKAIHGR